MDESRRRPPTSSEPRCPAPKHDSHQAGPLFAHRVGGRRRGPGSAQLVVCEKQELDHPPSAPAGGAVAHAAGLGPSAVWTRAVGRPAPVTEYAVAQAAFATPIPDGVEAGHVIDGSRS
jgi:hypothetical protein